MNYPSKESVPVMKELHNVLARAKTEGISSQQIRASVDEFYPSPALYVATTFVGKSDVFSGPGEPHAVIKDLRGAPLGHVVTHMHGCVHINKATEIVAKISTHAPMFQEAQAFEVTHGFVFCSRCADAESKYLQDAMKNKVAFSDVVKKFESTEMA